MKQAPTALRVILVLLLAVVAFSAGMVTLHETSGDVDPPQTTVTKTVDPAHAEPTTAAEPELPQGVCVLWGDWGVVSIDPPQLRNGVVTCQGGVFVPVDPIEAEG